MSLLIVKLRQPLMKPETKRKRLAKELIGAWFSHNAIENRHTFASLCDWWIQLHKRKIQEEQAKIDDIESLYEEYVVLGEKEFITKYFQLTGFYAEAYKDIEYRRNNNGKNRPRPKRNLTAE